MESVPSNLSPNDYAATVASNSTYEMLVPMGSSFSIESSAVEIDARQQLEQIAREPGNSALKIKLAQDGVSLTGNSDIGPGQRFESFADKLGYVMESKAALVMAIHMSMVASGGAPSNDEDVGKARETLRGSTSNGKA